jgi:hypothetical protein
MRSHPCPTPARRLSEPAAFFVLAGLLTLGFLMFAAGPASALLSIDFEQRYYVHEEWQVWDFCIVQHDGIYSIFYLAVPESDPQPANSDAIWRSTSPDLVHWSTPIQVIGISAQPHETLAVWAPDVVFDEVSGLWWMAYTSVDDDFNQRVCMAYSENLEHWIKVPENPVLEPQAPEFFYFPDSGWNECRDPYLYREDGLWHMTVSAKITGLPNGRGVIAHATSTDLVNWTELEVLLANDGETPEATLESSQYHEVAGGQHLFFHEYASGGIAHVGALEAGDWTMANQTIIDLGIAPEVDTFDDGQSWIFSRVGPYDEPAQENYSVVIRIDDLRFRQGAASPTVFRRDPYAEIWEEYSGSSCLGNPCFGDNPARRGEEPAGPVGNFYFGSNEYFRGPLSNRGAAGIALGESATGMLRTFPFVIEGLSISLLVGGTNDPEACYVGLFDAATDSLLRHATGTGSETMTLRWWDLSDIAGREVYIQIEDSSYEGHINVDEIHERLDDVTGAPVTDLPHATITRHQARPNPFNPRTTLAFELSEPMPVEVAVYDVRGRRVWTSGVRDGRAGRNDVAWSGVRTDGRRVPGGTYVYRITTADRSVVSGKLTLVP